MKEEGSFFMTTTTLTTSTLLRHPPSTQPRRPTFGAPMEGLVTSPYVPRPLQGVEPGQSNPLLFFTVYTEGPDLVPHLLLSWNLEDDRDASVADHHIRQIVPSTSPAPTFNCRCLAEWDKEKLRTFRFAFGRDQLSFLANNFGPPDKDHWFWRLWVPRRVPCSILLPSADHLLFDMPLVGEAA